MRDAFRQPAELDLETAAQSTPLFGFGGLGYDASVRVRWSVNAPGKTKPSR
jgi:hypothetical protein